MNPETCSKAPAACSVLAQDVKHAHGRQGQHVFWPKRIVGAEVRFPNQIEHRQKLAPIECKRLQVWQIELIKAEIKRGVRLGVQAERALCNRKQARVDEKPR